MNDVYNAALFGAAGRMGREILIQAQTFPRLKISYGYDPAGASQFFKQLLIEPQPGSLKADVRIAIDFSVTEAVAANARIAERAEAAYLCGVTGLQKNTLEVLHDAAQRIPVLCAPNMSMGMNLMFALAAKAAAALPDYDRQILETHHINKKDAPSGTAIRLAYAIDQVTHNKTEIISMRMGDVIGEHKLILGGPGERIEIIHRIDDRSVLAKGALRAAEWLVDRAPGFYSMADVLGI
ncbi:4-hydroxy-tetrahydrodipicolinate reductase [bacterium]|nr:4-hydroxy-tetrahydrodipicolinate reductase [bacterium]MBU1920549.1 4-hydroxy-tetrahydrodipicolinate reductase [bacterium]